MPVPSISLAPSAVTQADIDTSIADFVTQSDIDTSIIAALKYEAKPGDNLATIIASAVTAGAKASTPAVIRLKAGNYVGKISVPAGISLVGEARDVCKIQADVAHDAPNSGNYVVNLASNTGLYNLTVENTHTETEDPSTDAICISNPGGDVSDVSVIGCRCINTEWSIWIASSANNLRIMNNEFGGSNCIFFLYDFGNCIITNNTTFCQGQSNWCHSFIDCGVVHEGTTGTDNIIADNIVYAKRTGEGSESTCNQRPYVINTNGYGERIIGNKIFLLLPEDYGPANENDTTFIQWKNIGMAGYAFPTIIADNYFSIECLAQTEDVTITGLSVSAGAGKMPDYILARNTFNVVDNRTITKVAFNVASNTTGPTVTLQPGAFTGFESASITVGAGITVNWQTPIQRHMQCLTPESSKTYFFPSPSSNATGGVAFGQTLCWTRLLLEGIFGSQGGSNTAVYEAKHNTTEVTSGLWAGTPTSQTLFTVDIAPNRIMAPTDVVRTKIGSTSWSSALWQYFLFCLEFRGLA